MFDSDYEASYKEQQMADLELRTSILAKWVSVLFWVSIVNIALGILSIDNMLVWVPALYYIAGFARFLCNLSYAIVLLKLKNAETRFFKSGLFALAVWIIDITGLVTSNLFNLPDWSYLVFLSLPSLIFGFVSEYHEFNAHADVLVGADYILSEKWRKLWKYYVLSLFALICCSIITVPLLGSIIMLAAAITLVVCSFAKIFYLYHTANTFRLKKNNDI